MSSSSSSSSKYSVTEENLRAHGSSLPPSEAHHNHDHAHDHAHDHDHGADGDLTHRESGAASAASLELFNYLDDFDDDSVDSKGDPRRRRAARKTRAQPPSRCAQCCTRCCHYWRRCDTIFVPLPGSSEGGCDKCTWYSAQLGESLFRVLIWPLLIPLLLRMLADKTACPYTTACPAFSEHDQVVGNNSRRNSNSSNSNSNSSDLGNIACIRGDFNHTVQTDCYLDVLGNTTKIPLWYQWIDLRDLFPNQAPMLCHYRGTRELFGPFKAWARTPPLIDPTCDLFGYIGQGPYSSCYQPDVYRRQRQLRSPPINPTLTPTPTTTTTTVAKMATTTTTPTTNAAATQRERLLLATAAAYASGNETTTTTSKRSLNGDQIIDDSIPMETVELRKRMFIAFTVIFNTSMSATAHESDAPATSTVDTLLYKHNDNNAANVRCAPFGANCTISYLTDDLSESAGPWTPRRENYSDWWMYNYHYFYTDNVCVSLNSTNTDLFSPEGMRAEVMQPFGHKLHLTPNAWRYGSSTLTLTATAFNDTLAKDLIEASLAREAAAALALAAAAPSASSASSPTFLAAPISSYSPSPSGNGTNGSETSDPYWDPCERLDAIVTAGLAEDNVTTFVVATRSFSILVNETHCYGFVDIWPDVGRALGWPRMTVAARSFAMLAMASGFLFQIVMLLTLMPIVDRICYRKLVLVVSGMASLGAVGTLFFTCRAPKDYTLGALLCVPIAVASSLHSATLDAHLPLLASSDIRVARALLLKPPTEDKKRKKTKKKKKKKKGEDKNNNTKASTGEANVPTPYAVVSLTDGSIARKPLALLHRYMRVQDSLAALSHYRGSQMALFVGLCVMVFVWWYSDGTDASGALVTFALDPSFESLGAALTMGVGTPGENTMRHLPFARLKVDYVVALRLGIFFCAVIWLIALLPALFCMKWRWGPRTGWTCAKGCCYAPFKRKVANILFTAFHAVAPLAPMIAWSYARSAYFVYYLPFLTQFCWMLLFKLFLAEAFRAFGLVTFVHAQRTVGIAPFDLLLGGVTAAVCVFWGIGINVRWQRLNAKDREWVSNDVLRFTLFISLAFFAYAALRGVVSSSAYLSGVWEWYMMCALYGFASGPIFAYVRSYLSEFIPIGFEGICVGLSASAELVLSLVMPASLEAAASARLNTGPFAVYPLAMLVGAAYVWFVKLRVKIAREELRAYGARIQALDDRRDEYRKALVERKRRDRVAWEKARVAEAAEKKKAAAMMENPGPDITKIWKGEAGMDRSEEMRTLRAYAKVRRLVERHYALPFRSECGINCCTHTKCCDAECRRKGCCRRELTVYYWGWWCCMRGRCWARTEMHWRREKELRQTKKDLENWKKEISSVAYLQNMYVFQELVAQRSWKSLRWRTGWLKRNFLDDEETVPVIVRKERDRRKDLWEERVRRNEEAEREREARWAREADEKWVFAEKPTMEDRKKWGLPLFDRQSSSSEEEDSEEEEREGDDEDV